ncbi:purple acid phosphatase family protein ['Paenibacillus yunnanensis' Narsing Rao et al. 2020]|uniref:purple acid phosphatase family protein n=1 Tax=Paenibacillus tengchongensis TaxID=2608684 RepID=UPI00124F2D29|nr:metallophosphoesterase family protein [Paenibacillus tengchongensis]
MKDMKTVVIIGIIVLILILLVIGLERVRSSQRAGNVPAAAGLPYDLVTTFKGDAGNSRAFTWYTREPSAKGWLEVAEGETEDFTGPDVLRVQAENSVIKTDAGARGVHKAEAAGLKPGTLYSYRAGSGKEGEWSGVYRFRAAAAGSGEVTFINVTDSQGASAGDFQLWGRTLNRALETFPGAQFIVHNGDFVEEPEDAAAWDDLFGNAQDIAASVPLMPVAGNHDEVDGKADLFSSHFNVPDNGAGGSNPGTSYSFEVGPVHVTVLNTESNLKKQTEWLKRDLAGTDKPWRIVAMHRPVYGGNRYKKVEDLAEIFDKYNVDLVLQGHNHEYSRSYPLYDGQIVTDGTAKSSGTVYVVTNASGGKFNEKKADQFYHQVHFQNNKQMFAGIVIRGDELTYQAYDVDGLLLDEVIIRH